MITRADGIGPKIATRIVNELAEKLGKLKAMAIAPSAGGAALSGGASSDGDAAGDVAGQAALNDALSALVNLGYARAEAWSVLRALKTGDDSLDSAALIGGALKELGSKERR